MITLESQPEGLFRNPSLKADTYLDEATNLLYCKKCRTPRQKRIEVCGRIFTPLCLCACLTRAEEEREAEVKHREFLDRAICEAQNQLYSGFSPEELATLDRLQKKMLRNLSALTQNHSKEVSKS